MSQPFFSREDLLIRTALPVSTFTNWFLRGYIPLNELGAKKEGSSKYKYPALTSAYLICMKYHTGQNKKPYFKLLKDVFSRHAKEGNFIHKDMVIAISNWGKGKDCGVFDKQEYARRLDKVAIVPIGKIVKAETNEIQND